MNRFLRDISILNAWMGGAREMIDRWSKAPESEGVDVDQRREYLQVVVSTCSLVRNLRMASSKQSRDKCICFSRMIWLDY